MVMSRLRIGVAGVGHFGRYHALKVAASERATLVGVHDPNEERAKAIGWESGAPDLGFDALLAVADALIIAAPAERHHVLAAAALRAGKHVLVEKPIAATLAEADELAALAAAHQCVLQVGHLERFSAAHAALSGRLGAPLYIDAVRIAPFKARGTDVSVILDLMIHDLDLALAVGRGAPFAVEGEGARVANDEIDEAEAEVSFDDGFVARFRSSRVAAGPERTMRLVFPSGELRIDFLTGAFENTTPFALDEDFASTPDGRDRLGASLHAFLRAARGETSRPLADAVDGVRALDLALAVQQAAGG